MRKCILHAVWQAQGKGCSPGAVGVCIGGDRTSGYLHAKEQLFRTIDDVNPDARLAELEATIMGTVNTLGVGTMGFGGGVSLIGVQDRRAEPAARQLLRLGGVRLLGLPPAGRGRSTRAIGAITRWLYRDPANRCVPMIDQAGFARTGREVALTTPLDEAADPPLKVGDVVLVSGRMFTGRDAVHAHLMKHEPPVDLRGAALYHCGPVVQKDGDGWRITAAGPTTSIREEPYQADDPAPLRRARGDRQGRHGREDPRGAQGDRRRVPERRRRRRAVLRAHASRRVDGVSLLEFGTPEAMWHLRVKDFPAIVTMDAHGNSLHKDIEDASANGTRARSRA